MRHRETKRVLDGVELLCVCGDTAVAKMNVRALPTLCELLRHAMFLSMTILGWYAADVSVMQ